MSQQTIISEIIDELTAEIKSRKGKILPKIGRFLKQKEEYTFQQFNGLFGGKNNTYVDSVRTQFIDFNDFFAQWLNGLIEQYDVHKQKQFEYHGKTFISDSSIERIYGLVCDKEIRELVQIFLERNFYKQLNERTRTKPNENLWAVWFGNKLTYGLFIAPKFYGETWINDKSEIRRVGYSYWTIGHILSEGLVDPDSNKIYRFKTFDDFLNFYESILKRLSVSPYEHAFYDLYVNYLKKSKDVKQEPLLIPELRYKGLEKKHIHRLDFTLFNVHTSEFIGFELSPASTHMSVENLRKKQYEVNDELSEKWGKEMKKRNDYFKDFDITIITFTDSDLKDINACFEVVKEKLEARKTRVDLQTQLNRLGN
jgi:hypothetical protein